MTVMMLYKSGYDDDDDDELVVACQLDGDVVKPCPFNVLSFS